ncbi:MAG: hypothetical protein ACT4P5_19105, partial [Armatimonadota bacterium]
MANDLKENQDFFLVLRSTVDDVIEFMARQPRSVLERERALRLRLPKHIEVFAQQGPGPVERKEGGTTA